MGHCKAFVCCSEGQGSHWRVLSRRELCSDIFLKNSGYSVEETL